jgi:hypothetical protein
MPNSIKVTVATGDALERSCDVLAVKYAQGLYGVDLLVHERLIKAGRQVEFPPPWGFRFEESVSGIAARHLLVVGVPPLRQFSYKEIRKFGSKVLSALAGKSPKTKHVVLTLHGASYGLDEIESFEAELAGLLDSIGSNDIPPALQRLTFVERNRGRADRMKKVLKQLIPTGVVTRGGSRSNQEPATQKLRTVGYASEAKDHVFVAIPFTKAMEDIYYYGIQNPIKAAGLLCVRADLSTFVGDVMEWVRNQIKSATLVVAELSEGNPNVYLEVGYAWACDVPTVLVVNDVGQLKFDVRGQRCLVYDGIKQLEDLLTKELPDLLKTRPKTKRRS